MANRRSRGRAAKAAGRQTKSKKVAVPVATEVEVVEESGGAGIDNGIAVITAVLLLLAILFVDANLGRYGSGLFF